MNNLSMSNLRESLSERNIDVNKPTMSQHTPQPFRSKSSNNKIKNKKGVSPCKKSPKQSSMPREKPQREVETTINVTDSIENDVSTQCANMNLHAENEQSKAVDGSDSVVVSKRKNAKKKAKFKKLHLPTVNVNLLQPVETIDNNGPQCNVDTVHEYYVNRTSPASVSVNSAFLNNLYHHPQSQFLNNTQVINMSQQAASVLNTPVMLPQGRGMNTLKFACADYLKSGLTSVAYSQNAMQHPFLRESFAVRTGLDNMTVETLFPKQKKGNGNKEINDDKKFEPYLSTEEVDIGLENKTLLQGVLRINPKRFQHAYISNTVSSEQDILIDGIKNRNRALEGDIVVVQLVEGLKAEYSEHDCFAIQKRGKVVYIKKKNHSRTCIGTLKLMADKNRQRALFVPRDHRIPRLNIPSTSWPDNFYQEAQSYENIIFLAKLTDWFDTRFAIGKIEANIGQSGDLISESKAILAQTDLDITPYGPEVQHLIPPHDYKIPEGDIKLREDIRKLCIFSIDPFNCRDIDDAVSCRELENGNYEIGVHISDVAHFLSENSILNTKIAEKATTIYLVEKAYHMLPDELCMLCSLFPGVDKLAFSVFWEVTPDAVVLSHRFAKTVIHSCCQLAYEHAQVILEDKNVSEIEFPEIYNGFKYEDVYKSIKTLGKIAAVFRKNRFDNGALRIDQPKVSFRLNVSTGLPESFKLYENKESHQLIEEFMLLANITVANKIHDDHPMLAFLRCHSEPNDYMLRQLVNSLEVRDIKLNVSTAGDLHHSLLPYSTERGKLMVLNMLCAKVMPRAKYFCAGNGHHDFHHYALNIPLYTHFTSPIRRYADIMVHRLLAASLNYRDIPKWDIDKVNMVAEQCNKQKYNAKRAGELSTELYILKYIEIHSPIVTEAVVVDIFEKYIDVIILEMGLNRRVIFPNTFPGRYKCVRNDVCPKGTRMTIEWDFQQTEQIIEVFSIVKVEMYKGDEMGKIETKLAEPV